MALRLELKDGDRTLAVYKNKAIVERMLDAAEGTSGGAAAADAAPARRKAKKRRALGRSVETPAATAE